MASGQWSIAVLVGLGGVTAVDAQGPSTVVVGADAAELRRTVEATLPGDAPGAAVIVARGDQVLFADGRGFADLTAKRPMTADTPVRLGSIAKQFTAAIVLQLVAEGRIGLDDPLSRFFPDWPQPGAGATVRQLLNHSSGLFDFSKIPGWMMSPASLRPNTTADLVTVMRSQPAVSPPGARWEYNNGGYVLLGAIVEQVTGTSWHQVVIERIGRPLGLKTLAWAGGDGDAALGYSRGEGGYGPARGVHISVAGAAGALVASATDLARWARALHGGRVVAPALYAQMVAPTLLIDGRTEPYGFGLRLRTIRGQRALVHGGSGRGLDAASAYLPASGLFVAVLANTDDPQTDSDDLLHRLAAQALGQPVPFFTRADVSPATLAPLFGTYRADAGPALRFFVRDGRLWLGRGDDESEAIAAGDDRFYFGDGLTWFRFRRDGAAPVIEVHRVEAAAPLVAVRTGDAPPPLSIAPNVLRRYVGTYRTEVPVVTVALDGDGRLTLTLAGQPATVLRPVSATEFRVEGSITRIVFYPDGERVDRLTLHRGARSLNGVRTGD